MIHIAFCTDTNYVMPCGVAMTSICENNQEDITFHLVITNRNGETEEITERIAPLFDIAKRYLKEIKLYHIDEDLLTPFVCNGAQYISTTAFARIFLPELLPATLDKVLYLDCDLVCDGSLDDLWNVSLDLDCPLGAIVESSYAYIPHYFRAQIPPTHLYFNSGVLLINLNSWRKNNYSEIIINKAIEYKFPFLDQDALNHVFCGCVKYLNYKYNVQLSSIIEGVDQGHITFELYEEIKQACEKPVIFHYATENKPWKKGWCPKKDLWEKYLKFTIWCDFVPKDYAITSFQRTLLNSTFENVYSWDRTYFLEILSSYLSFYSIAYKYKNKKTILGLMSKILDSGTSILSKVYLFKNKQK